MVDAGTVGGDGSPGLTVAMHMSDGLVNAPTAAVFGLVAAIGLAIAASRARADLDERTAPMAGLVTAFVFAVQMINFPILPGASGHLLGGALVGDPGRAVGRVAVHRDRAASCRRCCSPTAG